MMRFIGVDSQIDRSQIQALRAAPPGLAAASGARRRVFGAALGQWDALLGASAEVPPAASPILLFYALSQAGRAMCAARISGQPWRASSHGLTIGDPAQAIGETTVAPDGRPASSFAMFCRALGASSLSAATSLGDLWASNPKLDRVEGLGADSTPALQLTEISSGEPAVRAAIVGPLAADLPLDPGAAATELRSRLASYPSAADGLAVCAGDRVGHQGEPRVEVEWRDADGELLAVHQVAPGLGSQRSGAFLSPALNRAGDVLPHLAVWWAILLALSSLARYHPERWSDALNRDRSVTAIPIEEALEIGRELLPWVLLHAMRPDPAA